MSVLLRRAGWLNWLTIVIGFEILVAVAGVIIGGRFNLSVVLAAGPMLTCARSGGRITAVVAALALALCAAVGILTDETALVLQRERFLVVLLTGALAIVVAITRDRREVRLIRIADNVQRAILRPLPAELGGIAFASHYHSATPGTLVGGDLYDLTDTRFGPRLIIGDVKGKGLEAVGRCAAVIAAFRELVFAEPDLAQLAVLMDAKLSSQLGAEDFVTVVISEFGPAHVRMVNCGHQPPLRTGPSVGVAAVEEITPEQSAPPLGLHPRPVSQEIVLRAGDRLLYYTDGLTEARDRAGRFLDLDGRVAMALATPDLAASVRGVSELLLEHAGHVLSDDILLVACEPSVAARKL